jgi:CBS domain-containing protein
MVTVGEVCNQRVVTVEKTDTVVEAARRMRAHHVGSVVLVEGDGGGKFRPIGIITDRDIVVSVVAAASSYLESLRVGDVATGPLITACERESLVVALARMRSEGVRRMPVVNDDGILVGVVAFDDLLEILSGELSDLASLVTREQRREARRRI